LLVGLAVLAEPAVLAVAALAVAWIALLPERARLWRRLGVYASAVLLVLVPAVIHNLDAGGDLALVAPQEGREAYFGLDAGAGGDLASPDEGPLSRARSLGRKLLVFWTAHERGANQDVYFFERYAPLLRLPLPGFGLVAPLGLAGMLVLARRRGAALLAGYVLVTMVTVATGLVSAEQRLRAVPVLAVFAAAFVVWWLRTLRARGPAIVLGAFLLAAGLALPVNRDLTGLARPGFSRSYAAVGSVHLDEGNWAAAERAFKACLALDPAYERAHSDLGAALARQGRLEEAAEAYRAELAAAGEEADLLARLGSLVQTMGHYPDAVELYRRAVALGTEDPRLLYNLALCLIRLGELDEAEGFLHEVLEHDARNVDALNNLGVVAAQLERYDEALAIWERVLAIDPEFLRARDNIEAMERERDRRAGRG
jgi:tetratricopeptide (TPR) repeat protein